MHTIPSRIVDTHQHVFWHGRDDKGLVADMDDHGVETAWLLTWEIPPGEDNPHYHGILNPLHFRVDGTHAGIPLSDILLARDRYPDRFIAGYCPHPLLGNAPALLQSAVSMYGIRVCGEWKFRIPFDDPRCLELFYAAGELNLPVVLHLDIPYLPLDAESKETRRYDPLWYGGTVENLERALQACPGTVFIGHAPGFWREISGDAGTCPAHYPRSAVTPGGQLYRLFDEYPNLYADLSSGSGIYALRRDSQHALGFLERFADRLLFARDYYGQELHDFLGELELSESAVDKIYCGNAEHLLSEKTLDSFPPVKVMYRAPKR